MGRNYVDKIRRVDEHLYTLRDTPSPFVVYEGRTDIFSAPTNLPIWQIKRIVTIGDSQEILFAQFGKYNNVWDLRTTYFPPIPPLPPSPPTSNEVDIYPGDGAWYEYYGAIVQGSEQTVFSFTTPSDKYTYIHRLSVDCLIISRFKVEADGDVIGSGSTGPGREFSEINWTPPRVIQPSTLIEVKINLKSLPVTSNTGVYFMISQT